MSTFRVSHSVIAVFCLWFCGFALLGINAVKVAVTLCNAFPGNGYVSFTWGSVSSTPIPYMECTSTIIDNAVMSGNIMLYSGPGGSVTQNNPFYVNDAFCADGNRNLLVGYSHTGTLKPIWIVQSGTGGACAAVPSGDYNSIILHANCALNGGNTVDFYVNSTKYNAAPVGCGAGIGTLGLITTPQPIYPRTFSVFVANTNQSVAGPIPLVNSPPRVSDATIMLIESGDSANPTTVWWASTEGQPIVSSAASNVHANAMTLAIAFVSMCICSLTLMVQKTM